DTIGDLVLDVQVPSLHVRCAKVLRDAEDIVRGVSGIDRLVGDEQGSRAAAADKPDRRGTDSVVSRAGIEGVKGELADEQVLRKRIVEEAVPGTQNRAAVAEHVVGSADAGSKIVPVLGIQRGRRTAGSYLLQLIGSSVQDTKQIVLCTDHTVVVPAQAVVQSQPARQAPGVLRIHGIAVLMGNAIRVAFRRAPSAGSSSQE